MHDGRLAPKNLGFQLPDLKLEHINIPRLVTLWFCHMLLHISTIDRFRLWIYLNMESVAISTYSSHSTSTAINDCYRSRLLIMSKVLFLYICEVESGNQHSNKSTVIWLFTGTRAPQVLVLWESWGTRIVFLIDENFLQWTHLWTMALSIWKSSLGSVHVGSHIHQDYQASIGMM